MGFLYEKIKAALSSPAPHRIVATSGAAFALLLSNEKRRLDGTVSSLVGGDIMKWVLACVAGVALTLSAASSANAQFFYGGGARAYYNPWTGGAYYGGGFYNPWMGGYYGGGMGYNPWSGRYFRGGAFANPYTGTFGYGRSYYNPWTGRYGYRYRVW